MRSHEVMFILKPIPELWEQSVTKYEHLIHSFGGEILRTSKWGEKRLAYEIMDYNNGYYVLMEFKADKNCVKELDVAMKHDDDVMRHMIIIKGE